MLNRVYYHLLLLVVFYTLGDGQAKPHQPPIKDILMETRTIHTIPQKTLTIHTIPQKTSTMLSDIDILNQWILSLSLPTIPLPHASLHNDNNNVDNDILLSLLNTKSLPSMCECTPRHKCLDDSSLTEGLLSSCEDPIQVCCDNIAYSLPNTTEHYQPQCGRIKVFENRIFYSQQSKFGEFPWTAAIFIKNKYFCGGFLIHPRVVVTVAHNAENFSAQDTIVRLGEWDLDSDSELLSHQDRQIQSIEFHPNYNNNSFSYDIALLYLNKDVILRPNVDTICLPSINNDFLGEDCYYSGWGQDAFGNANRIMKKIKLSLTSREYCQNALRRTALSVNFILDETYICAGGNGLDTCKGDGGSPLVCKSNERSNKYMVVGSPIWGIGCSVYRRPGVYASIPYVAEWIDRMVTQTFGIEARKFYTQSMN